MGHDKLRKFAENETFSCLLQPSAGELLKAGYFNLRDHPVKGRWGERFTRSDAPLVLELGCGKGEYTIDLAQRVPEKNYIGVDIKGARLWKGAKFATEHNLGNVAFLRTRIEFITAFFASGEVSEIWLTFSDPQVRSENSRLSSPGFLDRYRKFLAPGGLIHLKTDSQFLYQYTLAVCRENALPVLASSEDLYREAASFDPCLTEVQTFYESMFREQGYPIRYLCFQLEKEGNAGYRSPAEAKEAEGRQRGSQGEPSPCPLGVQGDNSTGYRSPAEAKEAEGRQRGSQGEPSPCPLGVQGDNSTGYRSPLDFDTQYWRSIEGHRTLFGRDTAETRRQKMKSGDK